MSGQKERPAVSAAGLSIPLGSECDKPITTIPAEAVDAAWNAMPLDAYVDNQAQVRAMLEAAAPHIQAQALRDAADELDGVRLLPKSRRAVHA